MKFEVLSSDLLSRLQAIGRLLNSKNTLPILDCFLFDVKEDKLTLTASDGENTMVTSVAISNVEGCGSFAVTAKVLLGSLKEFPQQMLTFQVNDENLEIFIIFPNGKYNLIGNNANEYPHKEPLKNGNVKQVSMSAAALLNGIAHTSFATSTDFALRANMTGIYFDFKGDQLVFVSTDSKKLVRLINTTVKSDFVDAFILPKKPALMLKGTLTKDMGDVVIRYDDKSAYITFDEYELSCPLIEGRYPPYEAVIPKNNINRFILDRQLFINVLRRVSVFCNDSTSIVKLDIDLNHIIVSAQDIDYSRLAEETVECNYEGKPMQIGFSATHLAEILNNMNSQEVEIQLSDPNRAALIVPVENEEGEDLLMLQMPIRLEQF